METDTTQFEFSHGRRPAGYGTWAFDVTAQRRNRDGAYTTVRRFETGRYGEAKKAALAAVRAEGLVPVLVEVLP